MQMRSAHDRRRWGPPPGYPFFDSSNILVREDRRRAPDRRVSGIEVSWKHSQELETLVGEQPGLDHSPPDIADQGSSVNRLLLNHKNTVINLTEDGGPMLLGRTHSADIRLGTTYASRVHLRIEFVDGQPMLTDVSKNGTYILTDDNRYLYLSKRKMPLSGSGMLGFGLPPADPRADTIQFTCL